MFLSLRQFCVFCHFPFAALTLSSLATSLDQTTMDTDADMDMNSSLGSDPIASLQPVPFTVYPLFKVANMPKADDAIQRHETAALLEDKTLFMGAFFLAMHECQQNSEDETIDYCFRLQQYENGVLGSLAASTSGKFVLQCRQHILEYITDFLNLGIRPYLLHAWNSRQGVTLHLKECAGNLKITDNEDSSFHEISSPELATHFFRERIEPFLAKFCEFLGINIAFTPKFEKTFGRFSGATCQFTWQPHRRIAYPIPPIRLEPRAPVFSKTLYDRFLAQDWTQDALLQATATSIDASMNSEEKHDGDVDCGFLNEIRISSTVLSLFGGDVTPFRPSDSSNAQSIQCIRLPTDPRTMHLYVKYVYKGEDALLDELEKKSDMHDLFLELCSLYRLGGSLRHDDLQSACTNTLSLLLNKLEAQPLEHKEALHQRQSFLEKLHDLQSSSLKESPHLKALIMFVENLETTSIESSE